LRIVFRDRRKVGEKTRIQTAAEQTLERSAGRAARVSERHRREKAIVRSLAECRWGDERGRQELAATDHG